MKKISFFLAVHTMACAWCYGVNNGPWAPITSYSEIGDGTEVAFVYGEVGSRHYAIYTTTNDMAAFQGIYWGEVNADKGNIEHLNPEYIWTLQLISGQGETARYKIKNYHQNGYLGTNSNAEFASGTRFSETSSIPLAYTRTFILPPAGGGYLYTTDGQYLMSESRSYTTDPAQACNTVQVYIRAYTIHFDEGKDGVLVDPQKETLITPSTIKFPAIHANCGSFRGWALDANETDPSKIFAANAVTTATCDTTYHAIYNTESHTIHFVMGEKGELDDTLVTISGQILLPKPRVELGSIFLGWSEIKGDALNYIPHGSAFCPSSDVTLYANYDVKFEILDWSCDSITIKHLGTAKGVYLYDIVDFGEYLHRNGYFEFKDYEIDKGISRFPLPYYSDADLIDYLFKGYIDIALVYQDNSKEHFIDDAPYVFCGGQELPNMQYEGIDSTRDIYVSAERIYLKQNATLTCHNLHIHGGARVIVPAGTKLSAQKVKMYAGEVSSNGYHFTYPQLIVNGALDIRSGELDYYYLMDPNPRKYVALALPYDVPVNKVTYYDGEPINLGTTVWFSEYDGATRAAQGTTGWIDKTNGELKAGLGYTMYAAPQRVKVGNAAKQYQSFACLKFPMQVNLPNGEQTKRVGVQSHASQKANDTGWNLLGNPYLANFGNGTSAFDLTTAADIHLLQEEEDGYHWTGTNRYVVIPNEYGTSYYQELASEVQLSAFKNFFVQIGPNDGNLLEFTLANRAQSVLARKSLSAPTMIRLEMLSSEEKDGVGVLIDDQYTSNYEINADLQKWDNMGLNFYALGNDVKLAFIAINDTLAQSVSIGYKVSETGTFTIQLKNQDVPFEEVKLYDSETHQVVDLLHDSYTFEAQKGKNDTRFVLQISKRKIITRLDELLPYSEESICDIFGRPVSKDALQKGVIYLRGKNKFLYE